MQSNTASRAHILKIMMGFVRQMGKPLSTAVADIQKRLVDLKKERSYIKSFKPQFGANRAGSRNRRMTYVTQKQTQDAIETLGHHIDDRLKTLDNDIKTLRTEMAQGFNKAAVDVNDLSNMISRVEAAQAASDKVHNENHLELKQILQHLVDATKSR